MTRLVQVTVAGDVAEGEHLQELLSAARIEPHLEPAGEHDPDAHDDSPLQVLIAESDVDEARDAIEALSEPEEELEE